MKKGMAIGGVIVIVVTILIGMAVTGAYNNVIRLDETVNEKWAQVENQLQRRYDLVPDLVKIANIYAEHEKEVIAEVVDARVKLSGASTESDKIKASTELESAISRLLVIMENYPTLKADTTYIALMDEMAGTENRIAVARKSYNDAVEKYNSKVKKFPTNILANMFGFEKADYFEADPTKLDVPKVEF